MSNTEAQIAWLAQVLGISIVSGTASADGPAALKGVVAYQKMLFRWRGAQDTLSEALQQVGTILLALPQIRSSSPCRH